MLERLAPIAAKVARNKTLVVMVSNHGQSEVLVNFVCSAKTRNLDISAVLVFATDVETKALAESLGVGVFYDEDMFGDMPKQAARAYADRNFQAMMMAKVFCVQ
jgi:hypothetical protein